MDCISAVVTDFSYLVDNFVYKPRVKHADKPRRAKRRLLRDTISVDSRCIFEINFQDFKDIYNTKVFQDNFQRPAPSDSRQSIYVTLEDVKDVVLYTAVYNFPEDFIHLFLSRQVDRILRSIILYMQYFLVIFRVVLMRRDAVNLNKMRHPTSCCVETMWKEILSDLRFIVAREYCHLIMGTNKTARFHHYDYHRKLSRVSRDLKLYQLLHLFIKRVVEVVLVEKGSDLVEEELTRLFMVGVTIDRKKKYGLTDLDIDILEHNVKHPRLQSKAAFMKEYYRHGRNSVLASIGQRPWLSRDESAVHLAMEFALAGNETHFAEANVKIGILGFERKDFDCFLNLPPNLAHDLTSETSRDSTVSCALHTTSAKVHSLKDKSVPLTGPEYLLAKRVETYNFKFEERFLGQPEFNPKYLKIKKPRWLAFRLANSRMNYPPDTMEATDNFQDIIQSKASDVYSMVISNNTEKNDAGTSLPTFFFRFHAQTDSEDDIYTSHQEGFYNEQIKKKIQERRKHQHHQPRCSTATGKSVKKQACGMKNVGVSSETKVCTYS